MSAVIVMDMSSFLLGVKNCSLLKGYFERESCAVLHAVSVVGCLQNTQCHNTVRGALIRVCLPNPKETTCSQDISYEWLNQTLVVAVRWS